MGIKGEVLEKGRWMIFLFDFFLELVLFYDGRNVRLVDLGF